VKPAEQVKAVTTFSTDSSRPALRAAACGGRPRAGSDSAVTGVPASPPTEGAIAVTEVNSHFAAIHLGQVTTGMWG
jgi:hypothetical protein